MDFIVVQSLDEFSISFAVLLLLFSFVLVSSAMSISAIFLSTIMNLDFSLGMVGIANYFLSLLCIILLVYNLLSDFKNWNMDSLSLFVFFTNLVTCWNKVSNGLGSNFINIFHALWLASNEFSCFNITLWFTISWAWTTRIMMIFVSRISSFAPRINLLLICIFLHGLFILLFYFISKTISALLHGLFYCLTCQGMVLIC